MAKVLACPACDHKHPLDLLVGLDSFVCQNCGRKLAVPNEVSAMAKKEHSQDFERASAPPVVEKETLSESISNPNDGEVVVLARASLGLTQDDLGATKPIVKSQGIKPSSQKSEPKKVLKSPDKMGGVIGKIAELSAIPMPLLGKIVSWLFALPFGFFLVVLLPRFFKRGFHASDFVGVITQQGIGRYGIVITLILFWSIATVLGVFVFNLLFRKLFLLKKMAK